MTARGRNIAAMQDMKGLQKEIRRRVRRPAKAPPGISLGRLIAQERAKQGLTQHELARAVDCPDAMIGHLEADRRTYWIKLREIIEFLAQRAGKLWLNHCTKMLMGKIDVLVWEEADPIRRLMLAEWLRSSGDRAAATSTDRQQHYLPGFGVRLKEPRYAA